MKGYKPQFYDRGDSYTAMPRITKHDEKIRKRSGGAGIFVKCL